MALIHPECIPENGQSRSCRHVGGREVEVVSMPGGSGSRCRGTFGKNNESAISNHCLWGYTFRCESRGCRPVREPRAGEHHRRRLPAGNSSPGWQKRRPFSDTRPLCWHEKRHHFSGRKMATFLGPVVCPSSEKRSPLACSPGRQFPAKMQGGSWGDASLKVPTVPCQTCGLVPRICGLNPRTCGLIPQTWGRVLRTWGLVPKT